MVNETEVRGVLTKHEFERQLKVLTGKYGGSKREKRLAIQILDMDDKSLWTRIRITDGRAEMMQKIGDWDATEIRELRVKLNNDANEILNHYLIIKNLLKKRRYQSYIIQHENYLFLTEGFEIKLSHQFGKSDKYPFEVEANKTVEEIVEFTKSLGLEPDLKPKGEEYWNKWNEEVNLNADELAEDEVKKIIKSYL